MTGTAIAGAAATTTKLSALTTAITTADSLSIDGKTISFANSGGNTVTASGGSLDLTNATVGDLLSAIDTITGTAVASTLGATKLTLSTGTTTPLVIGGNAGTLTALGLTAGTTQLVPPALSGQTLTIASTAGGAATNITFGTGSGQISTLNALNTALAANNLQASIDTTGRINIVTTNDAASSTIGTIGGTATIFTGATAAAPVGDPNSQSTRANLVTQYNNVLQQINTTAQDASFNGINLLNGDTLKLIFNETGKSTLNITGVTFNIAGLGLSTLTAGHRLPGQQLGQQGAHLARRRQHHAAFGSIVAGIEPVDRADPPGLLEKPDQCAADRLVQPDAGRHQRGGGQQPGAVDPPVDRGLRAGAGQPVAGERAAAPAVIPKGLKLRRNGGESPAVSI